MTLFYNFFVETVGTKWNFMNEFIRSNEHKIRMLRTSFKDNKKIIMQDNYDVGHVQ